jgi:site-specific recombinase XerD
MIQTLQSLQNKIKASLLSMLIETFIDSLRWSNRSISTVLSYRHDLISFLNHQEAPNDFTLEQFTTDALEDYFLDKSECVKPATLARYQSNLRSFCRWLIKKNYIPRTPFDLLESVKVSPPLPKANKQEELKKLFSGEALCPFYAGPDGGFARPTVLVGSASRPLSDRLG